MLDVVSLIQEELHKWEDHRELAVAEYNKATIAIETLKSLTDRMRRAVENEHETNSPARKETEAASRN